MKMKTDDWKIVKEILPEVLPLNLAERLDYLNKAHISGEVRAEIESLISFEEEAADLMNLSAVEFSKEFFNADEPENALIGQEIGVYRIIGELGQGGMGAVYLAERTDGKFKQKVALKLLKREMNTSALRRRFQQEREILASLEHPNIARLLDAGTTADRIPFLAMEYVEGLPIDDYSSKNNLNISQRLDLFRQVCAAVNFAHRNLIVHRDLKPSNILVSGEGIPKLLDFGISKILSAEYEQPNAATVTKLGAMTPGYASPEQLSGKSVTTATDIYSLGVILYELLSGHRPFEAKEDDLKEIYRAVLETEPPPPSAMIETISKSFKEQTDAETRLKIESGSPPAGSIKNSKPDTESNKIRRTIPNPVRLNSQSLRGDLDNIVLKALRKEPERRYSSAENFADDIHRHQRGLPVTARPNTFSYRAEKFFNRNKASAIAAVLLMLAIVGGIAATLWQARVARAERAKAEKRFGDVRNLAKSFLFEFSPKIENLPGSTPARELLVKRALEYLDNLSQEAGEDLELRRELAAAYEKVGDVQGNPYNPNIGETKGALESYEKAQIIRQNLLAKDPENIQAQSDLAGIYKLTGDIQSNGGGYSVAGEFYDKSLELREKIVRQSPADFDSRARLAEIIRVRGLIPFYEGDNKKALEFYNRAKEISEKLRNEQPENQKIAEQYAYLFVMIGEAQGWDNDFEAASKNLQTGLDLLVPLGEKNPNDVPIQRSVMLAFNKRAENFQDLEEFDKSVEYFAKGLAIGERLLTADQQSVQAKRDVAMDNKKLAQALDDAGKSRESLERLQAALKMFQEMGAADPKNIEHRYDAANIRHSIGATQMTLKDYESAVETSLQAEKEFQAVLAENPQHIYAVRMSSYNFAQLGKSYAALAEKINRQEFLRKSLENLQAASDGFKKLEAGGNLGEVDSKIIGETQKEIEKAKNKL